jgi:hypothetical protein
MFRSMRNFALVKRVADCDERVPEMPSPLNQGGSHFVECTINYTHILTGSRIGRGAQTIRASMDWTSVPAWYDQPPRTNFDNFV